MNKPTILAIAAAALLTAPVLAQADVRLTMHDGLVTIVAKDATVRQILAEWARVGQATIVNADRIAGAPVTIELTDIPERQALDILLRSVSGYFAAPRPSPVPNAARFDRIIVLPAAAQPRLASSSAQPPPLPQPTRFQLPPASDPDDPVPNPNDPTQRVPVVNQFNPPFPPPPSAPPPDSGRAPSTPAYMPTAPVGTAAPGMVLQPPPQLGPNGQPLQPGPNGQPGQPGQQPTGGRF